MPFFLRNCLKLRKKKNRKKPKIKDVVKPARDRTDLVTIDEIWPDCRESVSTISEQGNELDARACNEIETNVSPGNNSTPAVERMKVVTKISVAVVQEGNEFVEMDKKSKEGAFQIGNIQSADIKSDKSIEMLNKEQHHDPKSEEEVAFKSESISENSERRSLIFSLYSEPSEVSSDSSTVEITSEIQVAIDPHQEKVSGNDSILERKEKDAENNSMEPSLELQQELLVDASGEKVCKNDDVGFTEKNSEYRGIEEDESSQIAMKEMSKIIASVNATSNVFEKIEELRRLQCIINEKRQNQKEEVYQNTEKIKDPEISGVVNKEKLPVVIDTDCKENENLLQSSADKEDIKNNFNDDDFNGFEGTEFHHVNKLLTCDNPSKSHVTNFGESNASFSGDYLFKKLTEKETELTDWENTAGRTTNYEFITPESNVLENVGDKNEETILCSKSDKSSCILSVGESMASNTAEFSKDIEETSKFFSRRSCTGDMNYEIPLEYEHDQSNLNLKMNSGENFSKTDIEGTSDSFSKEGHNDEKKLSKSFSFEDTENNCKKLSAETGTVDLRERNGISVHDFQTNKLINKRDVYESTFNGETNMNDSEDHIDNEIKRRNVQNKIDGDFLVLDSNISNDKSKYSLSRNLDCTKEDHGSGDYSNNEVMNETKKNESDLQNGNESDSKNTRTDSIDMSVLNNIELRNDANMGIASELEKKDSNFLHLEEISRQIIEKNIVNDVENISDESKVLSSSDKGSEFNTVIDHTVEKYEIGDNKHLEGPVNIEECTDVSVSRNNLHCNSFKDDCVSFPQNCNECGLKDLFEKRVFDMNTNSNSRSDTTFDSPNGENIQYFNILQQFSSDTRNSFVIQAGLNVKEHSSANLLSEPSINNFATKYNTCEDLTDIDHRADFFQYNEKSRLIETSSSKNSAEDLKNICFPMNINRSEKMMGKKVPKENILNGQNENQKKVNDVEEFEYPILEMFRENINTPLKDSLLDENIKSKNKNSVFRETCFDSNPALDIKTSKKCSSESLIFESSSTSLQLESGGENTEENQSENIAMFANGDVCNKERTMRNTGPYNGAYLANEKKGKTGPALVNAHHAVQNKPLITINILPRISSKPRKIFSTRREDGGSGAKNIPRYKEKHDPDISQNFTRGIPENVLDEIEIRRRESLNAFNKKKKEALSDMKPTARIIPIMQSRRSGANSKPKRPPASKTSTRLHRSIEQSLEGPTYPFGQPEKSKIANGDGNMRQPFDAAELDKNTRRHSNESLHEISSQASEKMTPVRKRVLDVSREIRSRKYPVRIDGKTYVINARNRKNPYNLKPPELRLVQPKEKKTQLKEKQSSKHSPVKREFKIHSPEKIECLLSAKAERQNKPEGFKLSQDYLKMFDNAFGRYAGRGRLDSDSISYKRSREWLRDAGIVGKILTDDEANDAFKCTSGVKLTMNKGDYRHYIRKLARLKRLNYDELYEKLCSVVAKQSYAAREIM